MYSLALSSGNDFQSDESILVQKFLENHVIPGKLLRSTQMHNEQILTVRHAKLCGCGSRTMHAHTGSIICSAINLTSCDKNIIVFIVYLCLSITAVGSQPSAIFGLPSRDS